jgi:hypothetical protein
MLESKWDADYNESDLNITQIAELRAQERAQRDTARELLQGYLDLPALTREQLQAQFPYHRTLPDDSYILEEYRGTIDNWAAGRVWQVCHNCGMINFKNTPKETNKCYRCKSRNVTMLRAADISKAIIRYNVEVEDLGVHMVNAFAARTERLKALRKAKKDLHAME